MELLTGQNVWLPCEVKPGPFSDERLVRVLLEAEEWVGFVPLGQLQSPTTEGQTMVRAEVVEVNGETFRAKIQGHPLALSTLEAPFAFLQA